MVRMGLLKYIQRLGSAKVNRSYLGTTVVYGYDPNGFDATAFTADDLTTAPGALFAGCTFNVDGTATLFGNNGTTPASPKWWSSSPPPTWMSYTSTGTGGITGGLVAGTRYQLNTPRSLGIANNPPAPAGFTRDFTITFYDAETGGTTLGTKTFTANTEAT